MISMNDMYLAYRKAKVDLYYSSNKFLVEIADYEENVCENLNNLMNRINGVDESWVMSADFVGGWLLVPKSVDMSSWKRHKEDNGNRIIFSSPVDEWEHICSSLAVQSEKPTVHFRVMAKCSIDFHVLSTLWIMKVGCLFDEKLAGCACGNRLRRKINKRDINTLSLGSFVPYLKPFRDW